MEYQGRESRQTCSVNADEGEQIVAACRDSNVQLMDATMWVHHPGAQDMRRVIDESLGDVLRVTSAFSLNLERYLPGNPSHLAPADATHSIAESKSWELRLRPDLGGGSMGDLGWYCVRAILWTFGTLPTRVIATARWFNNVDLGLSAMLWFDNDCMASFDCGYDMATRKWFEVTGTRQSLVCDDFVGPNDPQQMRFWTHAPPDAAVEHQSATPVQGAVEVSGLRMRRESGTGILQRWGSHGKGQSAGGKSGPRRAVARRGPMYPTRDASEPD